MVNWAVVRGGEMGEFWRIKLCNMKETISNGTTNVTGGMGQVGGMAPTAGGGMASTAGGGMAPTAGGGMARTMVPDKAHTDIPGNPSTATSSSIRLSDRSNGESLRVLSEEDWAFWIHN